MSYQINNKKFIILLLIFHSILPIFSQNSISCVYAKIEKESQDSIFIAIHNKSERQICLFTGFLYSTAGRDEPVDQMLFLHRYNPNLNIYNISFVPLKPFLQYTWHMPLYKLHYFEEPAWPLTYEFSLIKPHEKFIYPISKVSLYKKEYIYDYFPCQFPLDNGVLNYIATGETQKILRKWAKKLKLKRAPDRNTNYITVEFAVYLKYDIITNGIYMPRDKDDIRPNRDKWRNFLYNYDKCNEQLKQYITVSLPLILNE